MELEKDALVRLNERDLNRGDSTPSRAANVPDPKSKRYDVLAATEVDALTPSPIVCDVQTPRVTPPVPGKRLHGLA
jgi:hypothetical protein